MELYEPYLPGQQMVLATTRRRLTPSGCVKREQYTLL